MYRTKILTGTAAALNWEFGRECPPYGIRVENSLSHKSQHLHFGVLENKNAGSFRMLKLVAKTGKFALAVEFALDVCVSHALPMKYLRL